MNQSPPIHVVAAAIGDDQGRILVARRHDHQHKGGLWEFPGGKLEAGETVAEGLSRELFEELGIRPNQSEPLICITHHYPECAVKLDIYRVNEYSGTPHGREGQPVRWLWPDEMDPEAFPEADRPVINALRLADRYMITGANPAQPKLFLSHLEQSLQAGIRLLQLRAHSLKASAYQQLASECHNLCQQYGAKLLLNQPLDQLQECCADGIHLTSHALMTLTQRPVSKTLLLGASCHSLEEAKQAERIGVDYLLLSPVQHTRSHPDREALGFDRFATWVEQINLPVYALGGMQQHDLPQIKQRGGQGIAAISEFWPA